MLWGATAFIDKFLLEHLAPKRGTVGALTLYSSLFSFLILPIFYYLDDNIFSISVALTSVLIVAGMIEMTAQVLYFHALKTEDTSTIIPFFQTIPIFSLIAGYLILGETLSYQQMVAGIAIMAGAAILSMKYVPGISPRLKALTVTFMLLSSICFALYNALFKYVAIDASFWVAIFWQHVGIAFFGIIVMFISRESRVGFLENIYAHGPKIFSLNLINESIYAGGVVIFNYALLLAPIALVMTVNAYQPVFVFLGGIFMTLFLPRFIQEDISARTLLRKIPALVAIVVGSIFLQI